MCGKAIVRIGIESLELEKGNYRMGGSEENHEDQNGLRHQFVEHVVYHD